MKREFLCRYGNEKDSCRLFTLDTLSSYDAEADLGLLQQDSVKNGV